MISIDPVTEKELVRFLVPTALGCMSYIVATVVACFIPRIPLWVYIVRLGVLTLLILLIWVLYLPSAAIASLGSREQYAVGGDVRGMGTYYGKHTTCLWFILAALKRQTTRLKNAV